MVFSAPLCFSGWKEFGERLSISEIPVKAALRQLFQ
jgi:hypothetical protein